MGVFYLVDFMANLGRFYPRNPRKYDGDYHNIIFRSSWEKKVMRWLDECLEVLSWCSEEVAIPYISPVDNKWHFYYPDMIAKIQSKDGIKTVMLEIKPYSQTKQPLTQKRKTRRYITEVVTYAINKAKWDAAESYCKDRGWNL